MPASLQVLPSFGTPSLTATIACNLTGADGSDMGSAAFAVSVTATLWPTFDDAIIVSSNGFSRSIGGYGPRVVNSTDALVEAAAQQYRQRRGLQLRALDGSSASGSVLATATSSPSILLTAMEAVWGGVAIPPNSARPFSLTLFGRTPLILRSSHRSFSSGTNVIVGGIVCNGTLVSDDGSWLAAITPEPTLLCGGAAGCAYESLVVQNPPGIDAAGGLVLGAALACPPFCSGAVSGGVFPLAVLMGNGTRAFVPAAVGATGTAATPIDLSLKATDGVAAAHLAALASSAGLFYSQACSDSGFYTDPSTGACTNVSDPGFSLCAFGAGESCRLCPGGAACPGGFRAWPLPGRWSAAEVSPNVLSCVEPDARGKCLGWSATLATSQCGASYRQGSYLCAGERLEGRGAVRR